jgi:hypothetical protein
MLRQHHHLSVKHNKCIFGSQTVACLGHIISAGGMSMDSSKVEAMHAWPLCGFLGLTGMTMASLLTIHPASQVGLCMVARGCDLFRALKQALTASPVLQLPDFDKSFIINCDTSGLGQILHHCIRMPVPCFL